jgi:hypothetical protein
MQLSRRHRRVLETDFRVRTLREGRVERGFLLGREERRERRRPPEVGAARHTGDAFNDAERRDDEQAGVLRTRREIGWRRFVAEDVHEAVRPGSDGRLGGAARADVDYRELAAGLCRSDDRPKRALVDARQ